MKKIIGLVGMGAIALFVMSSTCSDEDKVSADLTIASVESDNEMNVRKVGEGISFQKINFEKAKKEALKTGKLIFIDAYTDWCGPCKRMAATSFKDKEVGELFNENFINLKIEMEKNPDGKEIARLYNVRAYPTLIFIDGNGRVVKQSIGMKTTSQLIAMAESAL